MNVAAMELDTTRLVSARLVAMATEPYLDVALNMLTFIPVPGLKTFATDKWWRCYVDPVCVHTWSIEVIATVLRHEVRHTLMDHGGRAEQLPVPAALRGEWNKAADATINPDVESAGRARWPFGVVKPSDIPGGHIGLTAYEFYRCLTDSSGQTPPGAGAPGMGREGEGAEGDGDGDAEGAGRSTTAQEGPGSAQGGGEQPDGEGSAGGSTGAAGAAAPAAPRSGGTPTGAPCAGGSAVTGHQGDWELPPPQDDSDAGISNAVAESIRRRTATKVRQHASGKGRGTMPAGMALWAEDFLTPKHDWRKELAARLVRTLSHLPGREDYTYQRPSRRHPQRSGMPLVPGLVVPEPPRVDVILDTSGSMADVIGQALAETEGILKGRANTRIIPCDAAAYATQNVRTTKHLNVIGGGGTDMRVGMKASADLRPRSHVQIVITDMGTPWPHKPYRPMQKVIIVGCTPEPTRPEQRPFWATYVHVPTGQGWPR